MKYFTDKIKKIIQILLSLSTTYAFGLNINANIGTLGAGLNLSQAISNKLYINTGIHYLAINDIKIGSAKVSNELGIIDYNNSINFNNTAVNLGLSYIFFTHQYATIDIETGIIYNNYVFNNPQNYEANILEQNFKGDISSTELSMNKVSPYLQFNIKNYLSNNLYLSSSVGIEIADLKIKDIYSNNNYISLPVLPILQVGVGYSF